MNEFWQNVLFNYKIQAASTPLLVALLIGGIVAIKIRRRAKKPLMLTAIVYLTAFCLILTYPIVDALIERLLGGGYSRFPYGSSSGTIEMMERIVRCLAAAICTFAIMWKRGTSSISAPAHFNQS